MNSLGRQKYVRPETIELIGPHQGEAPFALTNESPFAMSNGRLALHQTRHRRIGSAAEESDPKSTTIQKGVTWDNGSGGAIYLAPEQDRGVCGVLRQEDGQVDAGGRYSQVRALRHEMSELQ